MKAFHGSVFRVPRQEPGAMACCSACNFSRFYPSSPRLRGSAYSRAKRALWAHFRTEHPEKVFAHESLPKPGGAK